MRGEVQQQCVDKRRCPGRALMRWEVQQQGVDAKYEKYRKVP